MKWIEFFTRNDLAEIRLFCFHHSGGSSSYFMPWVKSLPKTVELAAIQLPGRGTRFDETCMTNMTLIIKELLKDFSLFLEKPFILFGHSLGGLICFELARALQKFSLKPPLHAIISGCRGPHVRPSRKPLFNLPEDEFLKELSKYNGIPKEVLEMPELLNLVLPIIRADFTISDNYQYVEGTPLEFDITAFYGQDDPTVRHSDVLLWEQHTTQNFKHFVFPGDHFFIKSSENEVFTTIKHILTNLNLRDALNKDLAAIGSMNKYLSSNAGCQEEFI